jgi:hypothetical protein
MVKRTLNFVFAYMIAIFDPALKHYPPDLQADLWSRLDSAPKG